MRSRSVGYSVFHFYNVLITILATVALQALTGCSPNDPPPSDKPVSVTKTISPTKKSQDKKSPAPAIPTPSQTEKITSQIIGTVQYFDDTPVSSATAYFRRNQTILSSAPVNNGLFNLTLPSIKTYGEICISESNDPINAAVFENETSDQLMHSLLSIDRKTLYRTFKIAKSASLHGSILDSAGAPVSDATVIFRSVTDSNNYYTDTITTSTTDGRFSLANVPQAAGMLRVIAKNQTAYTNPNYTPTAAPLEIKLTNNHAVVNGMVKMFATDLPVSNQTVTFFDDFAAKVKLINSTLGNITAQTDENGQFLFSNLPASSAYISISSSNPPLENFPPALKQAQVNLTNATEQFADVIAYSGYNVSGKIFDSKTNIPISNATLQFSPDHITTSTADGTYIINGLFNDYDITVNHDQYINPPYTDYKIQLNNLKSPDVEMNFALKKAVRISGKITNENDLPIPHAQVWIPIDNNLAITPERIPVNQRGEFSIKAESRKEIQVAAKAPGYAPACSDKMHIIDSDTPGIHIRLHAGATVSGTVIGQDGNPAANINVQQELVSFGYTTNATITNQQGKFLFTDVPELSSYQAGVGKYITDPQSVAASPGQIINDLKFQIEPTTHTIIGKIIDNNDRPIQNAKVDAHFSKVVEYIYLTTQSDSDGNFVFKDIPFGIYNLFAEKDKRQSPWVTQESPDEHVVIPVNMAGDNHTSRTYTLQTLDKSITITDFDIATEKNTQFLKDSNTITFYGEKSDFLKATITAPGYLTLQRNIDLKTSEPGTLTLDPVGLAAEGTITDGDTKKPISGVKVFIGQSNKYDLNIKFSGLGAVTDENGKYQITNLTSKDNKIYTIPPDPYVPQNKPISPGKNHNEKVDFELAAGVTIKGKATIGDKKLPLPTCSIILKNTNELESRTTTDLNGEFTFKNIPPGDYTVSIWGHVMVAQHKDLTPELKKLLPYYTSVQVKKTDNEIYNLHVEPKELKILVTLNQKPMPFDQFYIYISSNKHTDIREHEIIDGKIVYRSLLPGLYSFKIETKGEPGASANLMLSEKITVGESSLQEEQFSISAGKISGNVVSADKTPVPTCYIKIFLENPTTDYRAPVQLYTNKNGRFETSDIPAGIYTINATHSNFGIGKVSGVKLDSGTKDIAITLSSHFGSLESLAIDSETGNPIPEAHLSMSTVDGVGFNVVAKRDANGILLVPKVPTGTYEVFVGGEFHTSAFHQVVIKADQKTVIEDALTAGGNFEWQLPSNKYSMQDGNYPSIPITVTPLDPESLQPTKTLKTVRWGFCHFSGLLPGSYKAVAEYEGKVLAETTFIVTANETIKKRSEITF